MPDISNLLAQSNIDIQRQSTQAFGAAVEQFVAQPLNAALSALAGSVGVSIPSNNQAGWNSSDYATNLVNSQFRPKFKFLFRVEFLFKPEILSQFSAQTASWKNNFNFLIKSVDRPKIDFDYEEVNAYNFHTKVLKSITHRDLNMSFLDDVGNNVHEFFRFMMMVHSPITRRSVGATQDITEAYAQFSLGDSGTGNGMQFTNDLGDVSDFAHRGVMNSDVGNAIQAIKVTQIFTLPSGDLSTTAREVSFFFVNPRIVSFDLDDMNHESNEFNTLTMQFGYDFMVMSDQQLLQQPVPEKSLPPSGTAPTEPTPANRSDSSSLSAAGTNNPYAQVLASLVGSAAKQITSATIGQQIRRIPGLGPVAANLSSLAGGITRDRLLGISSDQNQSFARPSRDIVTDLSTVGQDPATMTTSTGYVGVEQPDVNQGESGP